jgi:TrmH family RNA methyltransferase
MLSGKDNPRPVLGVFEQFDTSLERIDRSAAPLWIVQGAARSRQSGDRSSGPATRSVPAA